MTSIETTTASLSDVIFPSVFVCNVNQVNTSNPGHLLFRSYALFASIQHTFFTLVLSLVILVFYVLPYHHLRDTSDDRSP